MSSELLLSSGALKQLWFSSSSLFFALRMQFDSRQQQSFRPFFMQLRSNRYVGFVYFKSLIPDTPLSLTDLWVYGCFC